VLEKWLGEEATGSQQFDGIDLTNKLGADKVLFKVNSEVDTTKYECSTRSVDRVFVMFSYINISMNLTLS
jgi:hypothetical protein